MSVSLNVIINHILPSIPYDHPYDFFTLRLVCKTVKNRIDYDSTWWEKAMPNMVNPYGVLKTCRHMHESMTTISPHTNDVRRGYVFVVNNNLKHTIHFELEETMRYSRPLFGDDHVVFWNSIKIIFTCSLITGFDYDLTIWVEPGNVRISPNGRIDAFKSKNDVIRAYQCLPGCTNYFCKGKHIFKSKLKL